MLGTGDRNCNLRYISSLAVNVMFMQKQLTAVTVFSEEAILHTNGVVNRHNCIIWGSEKLHVLMEHVRDNMPGRIVGLHFFHESTITKGVCLDILQLTAEADGLVFQPQGAVVRFCLTVSTVLHKRFLAIGRQGKAD